MSLEGVTIDMGASYFSALKELIDDVDRFNRIVIKRRGFGFRNIANFAKRVFLDINYEPILLPT